MDHEILSLADTLRLVNNYIKRRYKILIASIAIGVILGLAIDLYPKKYIGAFTIETQSVAPNIFTEIILSINASIDQGQIGFIMDKCDCDEQVASSIRLMESEIFQVPVSQAATGTQASQIRVTIKMLEPKYAKQIEECIVRILMENPYVQKRSAIYLDSRTKVLTKIEEEITQLDSFQVGYYQYLAGKQPAPLGVYANGSHSSMLSMIAESSKISEEITLGASFYKVTEMTTPTKPLLGLTISLIIGLSLSVLTGFVISLILEAKLMVAKP